MNKFGVLLLERSGHVLDNSVSQNAVPIHFDDSAECIQRGANIYHVGQIDEAIHTCVIFYFCFLVYAGKGGQLSKPRSTGQGGVTKRFCLPPSLASLSRASTSADVNFALPTDTLNRVACHIGRTNHSKLQLG